MIMEIKVNGIAAGETVTKTGERQFQLMATDGKGKSNIHSFKALKFNVPANLPHLAKIDVTAFGDVSLFVDFGKMIVSCRELKVTESKEV